MNNEEVSWKWLYILVIALHFFEDECLPLERTLNECLDWLTPTHSLRPFVSDFVSSPLIILLLRITFCFLCIFHCCSVLFWLHRTALGTFSPGTEPLPSAVEAWNLNHWASREAPTNHLTLSGNFVYSWKLSPPLNFLSQHILRASPSCLISIFLLKKSFFLFLPTQTKNNTKWRQTT